MSVKQVIDILDTNVEVMRFIADLKAKGSVSEIDFMKLEDLVFAVHRAGVAVAKNGLENRNGN